MSAITPTTKGGTIRFTAMSDSGAAESVVPLALLRDELGTAPSGQEGLCYSAANGAPVRNEGKRIVRGKNDNGDRVELPFQVANVTKPLASVARMLDANNAVIYHPKGSYFGFSEELQS